MMLIEQFTNRDAYLEVCTLEKYLFHTDDLSLNPFSDFVE